MRDVILVALKAVIKNNGRYLIVKRAVNDEVGASMWEFPGGKLEFGEDLAEGLKREVKEETNLGINIGKLLYAYTFKTHLHRQLVIITYLCTTDSDVVTISDEHDDYAWVTKEQLKETLYKPIVEVLDRYCVWDQI